jgi:hypothetical protein
LCSTPEQSFTQTRIVPEVRSFEAVEDMISVDFFSGQNKSQVQESSSNNLLLSTGSFSQQDILGKISL